MRLATVPSSHRIPAACPPLSHCAIVRHGNVGRRHYRQFTAWPGVTVAAAIARIAADIRLLNGAKTPGFRRTVECLANRIAEGALAQTCSFATSTETGWDTKWARSAYMLSSTARHKRLTNPACRARTVRRSCQARKPISDT